MPFGDLIDTGLATGIIVAIVGGLVQLWIWRIRGRTAERLKGLDLSSARDNRALDAEGKAFDFVKESLEIAKGQIRALDDDLDRLRAERDGARVRCGDLEGDLSLAYSAIESLQERLDDIRAARDEALEDAFNVRTLAQSQQIRHDVEREAMLADLHAARWRVQEARLWIRQARAIIAEPHEPPPIPHWVDDDPKQLPPAEPDE
jgi:chromosome segregation ATPase